MNLNSFFTIASMTVFSLNLHSQLVMTASGLQTTVNTAAPGATIIVKNGSYANFSASFTRVVVSGRVQLNLDNQSSGVYFLRINLEGKQMNYKVIKQ